MQTKRLDSDLLSLSSPITEINICSLKIIFQAKFRP